MSTSTSPTQYDPQYVDVGDVPLEIPDEYTTEDKREALWEAEAQFEMERTGGEPIPDGDITPLHLSAIANLATYHLARGATNNSDVTLGDLDDGGEQTERHAEQFLKTYQKHLELISEAGDYGQSGTYFGHTGGKATTIAVNKWNETRRHRLRGDWPNIVHDRFIKSKDDT